MRGNAIDHAPGNGLRGVGHRNDRDVVTTVARDVGLEPLPRAAVSLNVLAGNAIDLEPESVRMARARC